jgi:hypothetical protein
MTAAETSLESGIRLLLAAVLRANATNQEETVW